MTGDVVLYHAGCYDGFGAAWAAWKTLGDQGTRYEPVRYGDVPPELINADQGRLYLLDFSFPPDIIRSLLKEFEVTVLDHHKTAQDALASLVTQRLPGLNVTFDMEKSGARLAWEHFHPHDAPSPLIDYLEDRDLWHFSLAWSREVSAALRSWPMDFRVWDGLTIEALARDGTAILRFQDAMVNMMVREVRTVDVGGHTVPVANATVFFSEVGDELCRRHPDAPFAAYFFFRGDGKIQWGLRSRGGFDVSEVAKVYGGGGHAAAAGFTTGQGDLRSGLADAEEITAFRP